MDTQLIKLDLEEPKKVAQVRFMLGGSTDEKINQFGKTLNPIFFQFDEELLNDFLSSYW